MLRAISVEGVVIPGTLTPFRVKAATATKERERERESGVTWEKEEVLLLRITATKWKTGVLPESTPPLSACSPVPVPVPVLME